LVASYSLADMELIRTGGNAYFQKPSDGWIECVVGAIGTSQARRKAKQITPLGGLSFV
jgi:hypothetical protein